MCICNWGLGSAAWAGAGAGQHPPSSTSRSPSPRPPPTRWHALVAHLLVVVRALAAHGLDHLLAQLHGRREGLGVVAQDVAEVDVEQPPVAGVGSKEVGRFERLWQDNVAGPR